MWVKLTDLKYDSIRDVVFQEEIGPVFINLDQVVAIVPKPYGCFIVTTGVLANNYGSRDYAVKESAEQVLTVMSTVSLVHECNL